MPWPPKIFRFGRGSNTAGPVPDQIKPPRDSVWQHLKRGSNYRVVGEVRLNYATRMPKDGEMLTLYISNDGVFSARAPDEFMDGRFKRLW